MIISLEYRGFLVVIMVKITSHACGRNVPALSLNLEINTEHYR